LNHYEIIVILRGELQEKELEQEYAKVEETINKNNGKVAKKEAWGKKKLAYEIEKSGEGFFFYAEFEAEPASIRLLKNTFGLDNNILRVQILSRDS